MEFNRQNMDKKLEELLKKGISAGNSEKVFRYKDIEFNLQKSRETVVPLNKENRFDRFVFEYADCLGDGPLPSGMSVDLKHSFEKQRERLKEHGISVKSQVESRWFFDNVQVFRHWQDRKYEGVLGFKDIRMRRQFYCGRRRLLASCNDYTFYQTDLDLKMNSGRENVIYNCPSCGTPLSVRILAEEGCPYCKARFTRAQLFPIIANSYMVESQTRPTDKEFQKAMLVRILKTVPVTLLVMPLSVFINYLEDNAHRSGITFSMLFESISHYLETTEVYERLFSFFVLLFMLSAVIAFFRFIITLLRRFYHRLPSMWTNRTFGQYERFMKKIYPDYSAEYFKDKVIGLYRNLIFSSDKNECLMYEGGELPDEWKNIMHSDYMGAIGIRNTFQEGNLCFVNAVAYADNLWLKGGRLHKETDEIELLLCKDAEKEVQLDYSPFKITCQGCGASFNAVRNRKCPYCGKLYKNDYSDWTVCSMTIRKQKIDPVILMVIILVHVCFIVTIIITLCWPDIMKAIGA